MNIETLEALINELTVKLDGFVAQANNEIASTNGRIAQLRDLIVMLKQKQEPQNGRVDDTTAIGTLPEEIVNES